MSLLDAAIELARKEHAGQKRKSWDDFIVHPLAVLGIIQDHDLPEYMQIAAILHDVCEDTAISNLAINSQFGEKVGFIIHALTKTAKPKMNESFKKDFEQWKKEWNQETIWEYLDFRFRMYVHRLFLGIKSDPGVLFIKMADQIHNLSDMTPFGKEKIERKCSEVKHYFLPLYKISGAYVEEKYIPSYNSLFSKLEGIINDLEKNL